ncbi:MAG TPA: hypothetical protein ENH31_08975 [Nitrospirae bacterium]|nr:hypothetical protein BMS3Bbin08_00878 [bacterium BMS3Bbin08]HDK41545.1 hypothetical protein [Nitrospirota bacterium]HDK82682.1 hypothetical protein [Nitrospirota bacterium]
MKKISLFLITVIMISSSALIGCTTVVRVPPPPVRVEVRPAPPYAGTVWIGGHWQHKHRKWIWAPGHWKRRPGPGAAWAPGHWRETPRGWKWVPGHWRR